VGQAAFYAYAYAFNASLLLLAPKLFKNKAEGALVTDFTPTNLAQQGSFVPLLIGRRRMGFVFGWAGDRGAYTPTVKVSGKGSKKKKQSTGQTVYSEGGWHQICVGPATKLYRIYQDGKVIYDTEITPDTTPSGSTLSTSDGTGDTFRIYWGEFDQAVNTYLGDASRVGISSAWPGLCYVQWIRKTLGPSPRWPQIEYDIERAADVAFAPQTLEMSPGPSFISGGADHVDHSDDLVISAPGWYYVSGPATALYLRRDTSLGGAGNPVFTNLDLSFDGEEIFSAAGPYTATSPAPSGWTHTSASPGGGSPNLEAITRPITWGPVFLEPGTYPFRWQADVTGTNGWGYNAQAVFEVSRVEGSFNGAIGSILFREFPHGLGLDQDLFDFDSLLSVSEELDDEGLEFSLVARDGEEAVALLGAFLQDAGVLLYRHPTTGLYTFTTVRQGTSTALPDDMVADGAASSEIVQQHQDVGASRLIFTFPDVDRAFRETAITVDADGVADRLSHHRARRVPLPSVIDEDTAKAVIERRSQEEFAGASAYKLRLTREARGTLHPGYIFEVTGIDEVLRVLEVTPEAEGNAVEVRAVPDYYGSEPSTYTAPSGGGNTSGGTPVAADDQATFIEVPEHVLDPGDPITLAVLRVRDHDQVAFANVHLSLDGTTYKLIDQDFGVHTGGALLEAIEADDPFTIETGPTLTIAGVPDTDALEDYTSDETSWRMGRQLAVIGNEIFFVRKLTAVSGSTYRLDGLIRARYDTTRAAHAIGAKVYVLQFDELTPITDPMLFPATSLYVKPQPVASTSLSLGSVTAVNKTLYGKGLVPPKPSGLRVSAPALGVPAYHTGEDVSLRWASRVANPVASGAGMFPANSVVGEIVGATDFRIEVYDASDALVRTELRSTGRWTYANADLQIDLGGETDFTVKVYELRGGFASDPAELAVEFLS
jgi:hypothetical protein